MPEDHTLPIQGGATAVRTILAEVVAGPDQGKQHRSGADRIRVGTAEGNDLVLADPTVSRFHLELQRQRGRLRVVDLGSTNGTRVGALVLRDAGGDADSGTTLELGETRIRVADGDLVTVDAGPESLGGIRGSSPVLRRLLVDLERVAKTEVSVLLIGESGTGKELVARAIHDESPRAEEPFVTVDCAAVSPTLFASELFGHERGAFTGAERQHIGAFERANGGTLFLDEVGELTPELQSALLGVLERGRLRRVGGRDDVQVDVRLVSATHRDLRAMVNAGGFRLDLFYRIAVVLLSVPPLRDRSSDIPALVSHFLEEAGFQGRVDDVFPAPEMQRLQQHAWPGNVRELRNVVLGTLALGSTPDISAGPTGEISDPFRALHSLSYRDAKQRIVDQFERSYLEALLEKSGGNVRQAARDARMDRSYLMELMKRHGLR